EDLPGRADVHRRRRRLEPRPRGPPARPRLRRLLPERERAERQDAGRRHPQADLRGRHRRRRGEPGRPLPRQRRLRRQLGGGLHGLPQPEGRPGPLVGGDRAGDRHPLADRTRPGQDGAGEPGRSCQRARRRRAPGLARCLPGPGVAAGPAGRDPAGTGSGL
ncbi:MAG: hypothetical protein AVDCRST_MAG59-1031, partial [uncultured Thermomicrobiales bacterium]